MKRAPHAFTAAENRVDKDAVAARKREQREFDAALVKTAFDGLLNAFTPARQADILRHAIPEASARYKALTDGPVMASLLGETCAKLNPEIQGGKASARKVGEAAFDRLTKREGE